MKPEILQAITTEPEVFFDLEDIAIPDTPAGLEVLGSRAVAETVLPSQPNDSERKDAAEECFTISTFNLTNDSVKDYRARIAKFSRLKAEEEVDLAKRMEAGLYAAHKLRVGEASGEALPLQLRRDLQRIVIEGENAKQDFICANLRLVPWALGKYYRGYRGHSLASSDLIAEGNLGLIRAVEKFDFMKGCKFSGYALWWIRKFINTALIEQGHAAPISRSIATQLNRIHQAEELLGNVLGRNPTAEEVATSIKMSVADLHALRKHDRDAVRLDEQLYNSEGKETQRRGDALKIRRPRQSLTLAFLDMICTLLFVPPFGPRF